MATSGDRAPRATREETERRINAVAQLLCRGVSDREIQRTFAQRYGLREKSVSDYIAFARARLREAAERPTSDLLSESYGFYAGVLRSNTTDTREQLTARRQLDQLLGLPGYSATRREAEAAGPPVAPAGDTPDDVVRLRELCRADLDAFARWFFPQWVREPFCAMHRDFFARRRRAMGQRGLRFATAAPRGYAKTTLEVFISVIHDCVYQMERLIVVISSTQTLAEDKTKQIRDELALNPELVRVFGPQAGPRWNQGDFTTGGGTRVVAASPGTQIRGLIEQGRRPSRIVLDDAEHARHVQTQGQRDKFMKWLTEDVAKLGDRDTNIELVGTILHPESALAQLLENPGYEPARYRAVLRFSSAIPLWQQWRAIFIDLDNQRRREDARAFYEANQAAMDADAEVLWPEHEAYYDLMQMRLVEGETAFQLEKQNNPVPPSVYIFDMETAGYFRLEPEELQRDDGRAVPLIAVREDLVAYWDPSVGNSEESDFSACVVVGRDPNGFTYVLDCYLAQGEPPDQQVTAVADLLWRWQVTSCGLEDNTFQTLLISDLREGIAARALAERVTWSVSLLPMTNMRAKPVRISTLQPPVANRWLWFRRDLPREFFRQFATFRALPDAGYDDACDATEGALRVLKGLR